MTESFAGGVDALQRRVLRLLGQLGGVNKGVIGSVNSHLSRSIAWDTVHRLNIGIPLGPDKVDVFLDPLFPVVLELAESSANRQTKVPAW